MSVVYILFEEKEIKGAFSSLEKAISHGEKLEDRGMVVHCNLNTFIHHPMSLDIHLLTPGEEPEFRKGFNEGNVNLDEYHPKMQEELKVLFKSWK